MRQQILPSSQPWCDVQGGADQGLPVIVSKVASNTPADLCIPRLNEGDQVLFINGRDISSLTHEQVNTVPVLVNQHHTCIG